jgi:trafficking protein particle complex subunit 2
MSYYFAIIGTQDNPLFEYEFGTSKQGGDGQSRFKEDARHLNQFIAHSSLDIVEEMQWNNGQL